jgi:hypothetical protein
MWLAQLLILHILCTTGVMLVDECVRVWQHDSCRCSVLCDHGFECVAGIKWLKLLRDQGCGQSKVWWWW